MDFIKIDDSTVEVTKQDPAPSPVVTKYDYNFLLKQRDQITADALAYAQARQKELDEVNALIAGAESAGVTGVKPVEVIPDAVIG